MIPFLFSKTSNIVNEKQTTNELNMSISFHNGSVSSVYYCCIVDRTLHKVYISFQISCKVFLGLAASIIYAQRKCLFL